MKIKKNYNFSASLEFKALFVDIVTFNLKDLSKKLFEVISKISSVGHNMI